MRDNDELYSQGAILQLLREVLLILRNQIIAVVENHQRLKVRTTAVPLQPILELLQLRLEL